MRTRPPRDTGPVADWCTARQRPAAGTAPDNPIATSHPASRGSPGSERLSSGMEGPSTLPTMPARPRQASPLPRTRSSRPLGRDAEGLDDDQRLGKELFPRRGRRKSRLHEERNERNSVRVRADHLAASPGRECLIDAHARRPDREDVRGDAEGHVDRLPVGGVEPPTIDLSLMNLTDRRRSRSSPRPGGSWKPRPRIGLRLDHSYKSRDHSRRTSSYRTDSGSTSW